MLKRSVIIVLVLLIIIVVTVITLIVFGKCCFSVQCSIPLEDNDAPLFTRSDGEQFVYPDDDDLILDTGESITIGCPGSKLNIGVVSTQVTCITDQNFLILDDNVDITSEYCEDKIKSTARYTGKSCENDGQEIEIGFDLGQRKFVRQMRICFDISNRNTLYSEHNLTNRIGNHEISKVRPYFDEGIFYNLSGHQEVYKLYDRPIQRATINKQLGIKDPASTEVIKNGFSFYLSRGHLAPKADFFYATQQNASFYYLNTAPQWGIINSKSWNILEWRIRSFATKKNKDLQIFTGTYGNLELKNYNSQPLYLYYDSPSPKIPIPEAFWKVVYEPNTQLGVVFVGTNNPFLKKDNLNFFCEDILSTLEWIKFNNKNMTEGFIYACKVDDLRSRITFIPQLNIVGILNK